MFSMKVVLENTQGPICKALSLSLDLKSLALSSSPKSLVSTADYIFLDKMCSEIRPCISGLQPVEVGVHFLYNVGNI